MAKSFEVEIWDGSVLTAGSGSPTMLATLDGIWEAGFQDILNESGSGTFKISRYDPKAAYVVKGNLVRCKLDGNYVFSWMLENIDTVQGSTDVSKEFLTVSGRGMLAYFDRAVIYTDPGTTAPNWINVTRTAQSLGTMLFNFLTDAHARGAIPAAQWDFTAAADSNGNPWTDTRSQTFRIGVNYYDLIRQFAALGLDVKCDYETTGTPGVWLHLYTSRGKDLTTGQYAVVLQEGKDFGYGQGDPGGQQDLALAADDAKVRSRLLVEGESGALQEVVNPTLEANPQTGRREGYLSYPNGATNQDLTDAGTVALDILALEAQAIQVSVLAGDAPFYKPFHDYDLGDSLVVDANPTFQMTQYRLHGITVGQREGGDYSVLVDLNSVKLDYEVKLQQQLGKSSATASGQKVTYLSGTPLLDQPTVIPPVAGGGGLGPAASGYNSDTDIDGVTVPFVFVGITKIPIDTVRNDPDGIIDTTGGVFRPTVDGLYLVTAYMINFGAAVTNADPGPRAHNINTILGGAGLGQFSGESDSYPGPRDTTGYMIGSWQVSGVFKWPNQAGEIGVYAEYGSGLPGDTVQVGCTHATCSRVG
jgi:Siphovirus ReqiPepy6 Gp37-like protein